jgi:predicted O-linked N-acetylglucosamine transferase (SPINDLY family)
LQFAIERRAGMTAFAFRSPLLSPRSGTIGNRKSQILMTLDEALQLALQHHRAGRLAEAEPIYRQVLAQQPDHPDALHLLGLIAHQVGRHADARVLIERAIARQRATAPADWHLHLGEARRGAGDRSGAEAAFRAAIQLDPAFPEAYNALGQVLLDQQRIEEAAACFTRATELAPQLAQPQLNLGVARMMRGKFAEAVEPLRRAVAINPQLAPPWLNLGGALQSLRRIDEAANALERAVALEPTPHALNGLGLLRMAQARIDEAIATFRRAVELDPTGASTHSNLLLALNYAEDVDPEEFFAEHLRWAERHERPLIAERRPHANERAPDRRLRVGYVSPDFKQHPVGLYIEPAIAGHRRDAFEVFCYSDVAAGDEVTARLQRAADVWRNISSTGDAQVAEIIRDDRIDILIDLAGHTARNRLRVFARKPAPVQVTYLGYSSTTGLAAMDYLLADAHLAPPGAHDRFATEKVVRLPHTCLCYVPPVTAIEDGPLPAHRAGYVTFASLNRLSKITARMFDGWIEIVISTPRSRLILHADPGRHLDALTARWRERGLSSDRLEIVGRMSLQEYFGVHRRIDVALDPFPHNGGTTSRDALFMGVPVITLAGQQPVSRMGLSALATIGLPELAADSLERYVALATALAGDLPRLAELRRTLRPRMAASPMMDAAGYVADLEAAYRAMWRTWCGG